MNKSTGFSSMTTAAFREAGVEPMDMRGERFLVLRRLAGGYQALHPTTHEILPEVYETPFPALVVAAQTENPTYTLADLETERAARKAPAAAPIQPNRCHYCGAEIPGKAVVGFFSELQCVQCR